MGKVQIGRVVIDTNVVVSALLFGGLPAKLIPMWKSGAIRPILSREIVDEYIRVLAYPKFQLTDKEINFLLYEEILPHFQVIRVKSGRPIVKDDPSDDKFLRCAEVGGAAILLTGDQHLLNMKSYHQIRIVTVSEFLESQLFSQR